MYSVVVHVGHPMVAVTVTADSPAALADALDAIGAGAHIAEHFRSVASVAKGKK